MLKPMMMMIRRMKRKNEDQALRRAQGAEVGKDDWQQRSRGRKRHNIEDDDQEAVMRPAIGEVDNDVTEMVNTMKRKRANPGNILKFFTSTGVPEEKVKNKNYKGPKGSLEVNLNDLESDNNGVREKIKRNYNTNRKNLIKNLKAANVIGNSACEYTWDRKCKIADLFIIRPCLS